MTDVAAILLAAGASRRLGQPKQLLCWHGRPLIAHCIETLMAAGCNSIAVVLGAHADLIHSACLESLDNHTSAHTNIFFGRCENWHEGQATSLAFGRELIHSRLPAPAHLLVTLCDLPLLTPADYGQLINAVSTDQCMVSATSYPEGGGVPACFHHQSHWLLSHPTTDIGAKHWIRAQPSAQCQLFSFDQRIQDIDTAEQWAQLSRLV